MHKLLNNESFILLQCKKIKLTPSWDDVKKSLRNISKRSVHHLARLAVESRPAAYMLCFCFFFNDFCQTNHLNIYQTDLCQIFRVDRTMAVISFSIPQLRDVAMPTHFCWFQSQMAIALFLHSSSAGWTTETVSWSTCLSLTSSVSSQSKMPQQGSSSTWDVVTTSPTRSSVFISSACRSELHSRWRRWRLHGSAPPYLASSLVIHMCRLHAAPTQAQVRLHWTAWHSNLSSDNYRRSCLSCCWSKGVEWPAKRCYVGLVAVGVQEQAEDILVLPLLRNCLTLMTFPLPVIISPPEQWSLQ